MRKEPTQQELEQLRDAIFARRKIDAIKLYRRFSGCNLKEAKRYIENIHADLKTRHPEKFTPQSKAPLLILALVIVSLLILFWFLQGNT